MWKVAAFFTFILLMMPFFYGATSLKETSLFYSFLGLPIVVGLVIGILFIKGDDFISEKLTENKQKGECNKRIYGKNKASSKVYGWIFLISLLLVFTWLSKQWGSNPELKEFLFRR